MSPENDSLIPTENSDMRYFPRWEVNSRVSYYLEGDHRAHHGETRDLSCAGACIAGSHDILPHQKVKVTIDLSPKTKINLKANVLWVKMEAGKPVMGLTFYDTSDTTLDMILRYAFELDRERFIRQMYRGWNRLS